jgi:hypothetical protein
MLDIFNSNAFGVVRLTQAINNLSFVPGRIGELGLFSAQGVDTTTILVEKKGDLLILVPPSQRGGPGTTLGATRRDLRPLVVPHFEINDTVYAESVQGVRAFGSETGQLETVMGKVTERLQIAANSFAATEEFARIGAVKGVITYADGSTTNLFTEFDVSQIAELAFDLANKVNGNLRQFCSDIVRTISDELGGLPFSGLHAFCGDDFFDDLLKNPEVRETYKGWSEAQILRDGYLKPNRSSYGIFEFGGIVWENYRGAVGSTGFINTDKCHIFPLGVPGLFKTVWSPADYEETVNTMGKRLYARQYPMQNGKGRNLDSQMNALHYCSRPRVLLQGKRSA